jgi:mannosyltransferase
MRPGQLSAGQDRRLRMRTFVPDEGICLTAATAARVSLEFDDIVYRLQPFGGISQYWHEVTSRVAADPAFSIARSSGGPLGRMRVRRTSSEVFHSSYFRVARGASVRNVTTVHDLAYELGHAGSGIKASLHRLEHRRAYFASDALICVSAATRDDLLRTYPALAGRCEIHVIHHGAPAMPPAAAPGTPDAPFVLHVGGRGAYKNFGTALQAFAASKLASDGYRMVCTGSPFSRAEQARIDALGLAGSVRAAGIVDPTALAVLYRQAHCLLYPSLFEGFGLPLVEAMQLGCPVIASNRSVMPEIAGDAALLVDGLDVSAMASALQAVADPALRDRLIAQGRSRAAQFSWDKSAAQHAMVYRSLARHEACRVMASSGRR